MTDELPQATEDVEPVDASEVRPPRSILTNITQCWSEGHDPGEWLPKVTFNGEVRARKRYCRKCGRMTDFDSFNSNPKTSYVFVDKPWFPHRLSCYEDEEHLVECTVCEDEYGLSLHAGIHVTEMDHRARHHAERDHEDHYADLCPSCWQRVADVLGFEPMDKAKGGESSD